MPKNRRLNTAAGKKRKIQTHSLHAGHDIAGICIVIAAVCMALALFVGDSAYVTSFIRDILMLSFGMGALIVPVCVGVWGTTFFLPASQGINARIAAGLALIASSLLGIVSLMGAESLIATNNFAFFTSAAWAQTHGGIYGGLIAEGLAFLFGQTISIVILVGVLIAGVVMCGFSISAFVERGVEHAKVMHEQHVQTRASQKLTHSSAPTRLLKRNKPNKQAYGEEETTYLGRRKRSVLVRDDMPSPKQHPPLEAQTTLLAKDKKDLEDSLEEERLQEPPQNDLKNNDDVVTDDTQKQTRKKRSSTRKRKDDVVQDSRPGTNVGTLELPAMSMLSSNPTSASASASNTELKATAQRLQATLEEFGLKSKVKGWVSGPLVTTFKIEMGEGERVSRISNLEDDIALSLAAGSVRIFAPIPHTSLVGIEIPNQKRNNVFLGDVLPEAVGGPLEIAVGRNSEGSAVVIDLASLPHLLVAGTTGSGKSVMLNDAIMSILMRATPEQVRFILVDPKRVEFTGYAGLPHLYVPVVNEPQQAASALQWAVQEMVRRLKVFEHAGARDIKAYNKLVDTGKLASPEEEQSPEPMPYFVIVIDELADLMMVAGKDVEASIVRIAQLGRAAGIHLIVATQRPSADVVTGLIKANIDNRVALSVDNGMNSRIILDQTGAEKLLGNGDMLVKLRGKKPIRVQGCYVSDPEISSAVSFINAQGEPTYHDEILSVTSPVQLGATSDVADNLDPLFWDAAQLIIESGVGSTSGLQRHLKVGYARAGRIMDMLESKGVVGPPDGSKPREVLLDAAGLEELKSSMVEFQGV